jgi:hypothetical protein
LQRCSCMPRRASGSID